MASRTTKRVPLGELALIRSGYQDVTRRHATRRESETDKTAAALLTPTALREGAGVDFDAIEMMDWYIPLKEQQA